MLSFIRGTLKQFVHRPPHRSFCCIDPTVTLAQLQLPLVNHKKYNYHIVLNRTYTTSQLNYCIAHRVLHNSMSGRYKFTRADFGDLTVKPLHIDLYIDVIDTRVNITTTTTFLYNKSSGNDLNEFKLNANGAMSIHQFSRVNGNITQLQTNGKPSDFVAHVQSFDLNNIKQLQFNHDKANDSVTVTLDTPVKAGDQFTVQSRNTVYPNNSVLEGIYFDYTPTNCPQTMITQCQQYGFQRIVPSVDQMPSKAYYTTTIIADSRYTNVIASGDLDDQYVDSKSQLPAPHNESADERPSDVPSDIKRVIYKYNSHITNMASYLFFLGCGTYSTYRRSVEYPTKSGYHQIQIELLVFKGLVADEYCISAVNSLNDHIIWNYLSTGPEQYQHSQERKKIYELIKQRDQLIESSSDPSKLKSVRDELSQLCGAWNKFGYMYTGRVYREIAMENSDYGGMENVGNTTIISSRITASPLQTDGGYLYMEGVKIHEFYHNINGSQVTGQSPFEIWLNEAVTVHVQRQREEDMFGHDFMRLQSVKSAFLPSSGPMVCDTLTDRLLVHDTLQFMYTNIIDILYCTYVYRVLIAPLMVCQLSQMDLIVPRN